MEESLKLAWIALAAAALVAPGSGAAAPAPAPLAITHLVVHAMTDDDAGVQFDLEGDSDSSAGTALRYGFEPVASDTGLAPVRLPGTAHFATSLFGLREATTYRIVVTGTRAGERVEAAATFTTRPAHWWRVPVRGPLVHVSPAGDDRGDGSPGAPKRTIAAAWAALLAMPEHGRGGGVALGPGTYRESVTLYAPEGVATPEAMYHVVGAGADSTILSGADERLESGTRVPAWHTTGAEGVYAAAWPGADSIGGIWLDGGADTAAVRLYRGESFDELASGRGRNGVGAAWTFRAGAWFARGETLLVRTPLGDAPGAHVFHAGIRPELLYVRTPYVRVHGIGFRFAGGGSGNGIALRFGTGGRERGRASGGIVDSCRFDDNTREAVYAITGDTTGNGDSLVVAGNAFHDGVYRFGYTTGKRRREENVNAFFGDGAGLVIRGNTVRGFFNGLSFTGGPRKPRLESEITIDHNDVREIADDGIELDDGAAINVRCLSNTIRRVNNGISIAPIAAGPLWVIHDTIAYPTPGGGAFKIGGTPQAPCSGWAFFFHNTVFADSSDVAGLYSVGGYSRKVFVNDLFATGSSRWPVVRQSPGAFAAADSEGAATNAFDFDVMATWGSAATPVQWFRDDLDSTRVRSRLGWQRHGWFARPSLIDTSEAHPNYANRGAGRDAAVRIPGVNDHDQFFRTIGPGPDVGAWEYDPAADPRRTAPKRRRPRPARPRNSAQSRAPSCRKRRVKKRPPRGMGSGGPDAREIRWTVAPPT